jgi:plasmid rolling circle replication initiator protein Rep
MVDELCSLKEQSFKLAEIYSLSERFDLVRYAERVLNCSTYLYMRRQPELERGDALLFFVDSVNWCRVRLCPPCIWAKSGKLRSKLFKVVPKIIEAYPLHKFLFLTLTCRNDLVENSRETISLLNRGWHRLSNRKTFPAIGCLRSLEVTMPFDIYYQGEFVERMGEKSFRSWCQKNNPDWEYLEKRPTNECNWHLHCLLIVPPSYFSGDNYWSHETWVNNWRQSAKLSYSPVVHIHKVNSRRGESFQNAILEVSKYTIKPSDLILSPEWTIALTDQIKGVKSFTVSGVFRQFIKQNELDRLEATGNFGDEIKQEGELTYFRWDDAEEYYQMFWRGQQVF